jgi:hypothetical protein
MSGTSDMGHGHGMGHGMGHGHGMGRDRGHADGTGGLGGGGLGGLLDGLGGGGLGGGGLGGLLDGIRVYVTDFTALNNSGVHAHALLFLDPAAQTLTVHIRADGLEPGRVHAQHIHGFADDTDAKTPTILQDDDGDGFVELMEGLETYGPVQLNLTTEPGDPGQFTGMAGIAFPTADADGRIRYTETFRFDRSDPDQQMVFDNITPLQAKELVLHGLTLREGQGGDGGEADGTAGYKGVLPVASGELHEVGFGGLLSALIHNQLGHADSNPFGA